jgi:hypothetical protein
MPGDDGEFAVFAQGDKGPEWRAFFGDLESAKKKAQELASTEGLELFVFSLKDASEVARFFPKPKPGALRN